MGKNTHLGLAGPDDPIYKEGVTMYAKPSFPQQESSRKSKAGTPNSQQLPSQMAPASESDDKTNWEDEEERLDTIHVLKRRLLMLQRNGARPDLIQKLSKQLKDIQDQSEST
jgi:hypothetical protein